MFTVVIATFNAGKTLGACLESLRTQTYRDFEIVIADGVSTDDTLAILGACAGEISFQISEKDRSIYDAWNKVIPHAKGEWFLFLGADDTLWDSDVLKKAATRLSGVTENVAYGKVAMVLPNGEVLNFEGEPWTNVSDKFRHEMTIPHQGTFHRRSLFTKHGLFDPSFKICGDYEFLLRELKNSAARLLDDLIVTKMAFGGVSSTYQNVPRIIEELSIARRKNGFSGPSGFIFLRWCRFYIRRSLTKTFGTRFAEDVSDVYRRVVGKPVLWSKFRKK